MSGAPRVKINNNLQVAVCLRVGWLSLWGQLWRCGVSGSAHGRMGSLLSCCRRGPESKIGRHNNSRKSKLLSRALTLSFCVYPLAGPLPTHSPRILIFAHFILVSKIRYLVLSSPHSLKVSFWPAMVCARALVVPCVSQCLLPSLASPVFFSVCLSVCLCCGCGSPSLSWLPEHLTTWTSSLITSTATIHQLIRTAVFNPLFFISLSARL